MSKFAPELASPKSTSPTSSSYWVVPGLLLPAILTQTSTTWPRAHNAFRNGCRGSVKSQDESHGEKQIGNKREEAPLCPP